MEEETTSADQDWSKAPNSNLRQKHTAKAAFGRPSLSANRLNAVYSESVAAISSWSTHSSSIDNEVRLRCFMAVPDRYLDIGALQ